MKFQTTKEPSRKAGGFFGRFQFYKHTSGKAAGMFMKFQTRIKPSFGRFYSRFQFYKGPPAKRGVLIKFQLTNSILKNSITIIVTCGNISICTTSFCYKRRDVEWVAWDKSIQCFDLPHAIVGATELASCIVSF
jgi:hypothetical protein